MATTLPPGQARWIDLSRDLNDIAQLLASAFADRLDEDGYAALRQLRRIARSRRAQRWYRRQEVVGAPLYGYVWEAEGHIVGNVSLIPLAAPESRQYLVVNVAVQPAYRRRGIARQLMQHTLDYTRQRGAQAVWLQVETWNTGAIALYRELGFTPRDIVTLWHVERETQQKVAPAPDLQVRARLAARHEWHQQLAWLEALYPSERPWHHPLPAWRALEPSWRGFLWRLVHPLTFQQWIGRREGRLSAAVIWLPRPNAPTDALMLAAPPSLTPADLTALLAPLRARVHRPLRAELPQGFLTDALLAAGFHPSRHLLWMRWQPPSSPPPFL